MAGFSEEVLERVVGGVVVTHKTQPWNSYLVLSYFILEYS